MPAESSPAERPADLYRLLIERVTDYAIFALDPDGYVVSWNPGAQRMKQYTAGEIIGKHFSVFYPPEDAAAGRPANALRMAREHGHYESEGWRVRKDGTRFWADAILTAMRDDEGRLVGFAKITRDLTARREAEEQARRLAAEEAARAESERRSQQLALLNEQLQQQAVELESQTEEAQSLTEDLEQANVELEQANETLRRALDASSFLAEASRVLGASLRYEKTLKSVAESAVPRLADWCAVDIVMDPAARTWPPRIERVAVVHQDPSKIRFAEELAERFPQNWDVDTGLPAALKHGRTEFYPVIDDAMLVASARNPEELRVLRELGFSSAMVVPLIARGLTLGAVTMVFAESGRHYDESDRDLAEALAQRAAVAVDNSRLYREAERARAEAEEANRAKSQFLARMSHELRTPLNAIAGYAELLEMGLQGPLNDAQREAIHRVQRSQRTLLSLIEDVLNFARLEGGHIEYRFQDVALDDVVAGVESIVAPQLQEKGLTYQYHCTLGGVTVWADPDKVEQILLNLAINAIKFTEKGSITVTCDAHGDDVFVRVADTGIGIAPEKQEMIFDPFVQAQPALTRTTAGSGLGLAISRELARAMGGDVSVESEVGRGSTFTLRLRRREG